MVPSSDKIILKPYNWPLGPHYPIAARQKQGRFRLNLNPPPYIGNIGDNYIYPQISGDNFGFVDVDSPTQDARFALRDINANLYVIYVQGAAGAEQLRIQPAFAFPLLAALPAASAGMQFTLDSYLRVVNFTTFAHWHDLSVTGDPPNHLLFISARTASNPAPAAFNPGLNFRFTGGLIQFRDIVNINRWYTPWIDLRFGPPVLRLDFSP